MTNIYTDACTIQYEFIAAGLNDQTTTSAYHKVV